MKQRRQYSSHRLSRDAERLVWLARGLADSGSRAEDTYWTRELDGLIARLLAAGQEEPLNQALDRLHEGQGHAYDELADLIEAGVESEVAAEPDGPVRVVLLALPVMAWSRYAIPAATLPDGVLANLRVQLKAHVLADGARLGLADFLFSPDQLPRGFVDTRGFARNLAGAARADGDLAVPTRDLPETGHYVTDLRYILASVAVPVDRPLFRWNETDGDRETARVSWEEQAGTVLRSVLAGCGYQPLLPDAYFSAWRRADREVRAYSLPASVAYLRAALDVPADGLRAVAAPYHDQRLVEWRVGFGLTGHDEVLHGVVWPLLGAEDEGTDVGGEIERLLRQAGLTQVTILDQRMPLEYCDDCGAPLFPNAEGESTHAEMPESAGDNPPMHLH